MALPEIFPTCKHYLDDQPQGIIWKIFLQEQMTVKIQPKNESSNGLPSFSGKGDVAAVASEIQ